MPSSSTNVTSPKRDGNTIFKPYWYLLEVLPVTLTVVLGPLIAVAYHLTQRADAAHGSFSIAQAARGLFCILMFTSMIISKKLNLLKHRLVRPLLFLAAYAVLTLFASPYPYEHIVFAVKMGFIMLVFASAFRLAEDGLCTERWLTTCAWLIIVVLAVCMAVGLAIGSTVNVYKSRYATAGFTGNPAVTSRLVLSTLPVFVRFISDSSSGIVAMVLLFTSLFFTMRRSSLIAGTAATCISILINLSRCGCRVLWRRTMMLVGILILLGGIVLNTTAGTDLMRRFRSLNPYEGSGSGRYILWRVSLAHIISRPVHAQLLGEGMGSIRDVLKAQTGLSIGAHNDWLDLVHAFGLFGLIGISWWYFELGQFAWGLHNRREGLFQGACASVIILCLMSVGTGGFFDPSWALTYAAIGFWAGHTAYAKQHRSTQVD